MKPQSGRSRGRITEDDFNESLSPVLDKNIGRLERRKAREDARSSIAEIIAAKVTAISGSMGFVYVHLALVGAWAAINTGLVPGVRPFDPTFVILATVASVEAIFLSTFVLISQNRDAALAERRAELDLHINLLAERELTTLIRMVRDIAEKLDVSTADHPDVDDAERKIAPEKVLDRLDGE